MREVWNDFGLLVFFTTVMVMELEQSNSTAANSWQEESILQLTPRSLCKHHSHYHGNPTIWPLESGNLLAACYHGISFHRAPLSSCTEDNWWCRWGPTPVALFFSFFFNFHWSSLTDHLSAVETCLICSFPALVRLVLILHSGQAGRQAARLIMIDSEITELILEKQ